MGHLQLSQPLQNPDLNISEAAWEPLDGEEQPNALWKLEERTPALLSLCILKDSK